MVGLMGERFGDGSEKRSGMVEEAWEENRGAVCCVLFRRCAVNHRKALGTFSDLSFFFSLLARSCEGMNPRPSFPPLFWIWVCFVSPERLLFGICCHEGCGEGFSEVDRPFCLVAVRMILA
ncbi:hypothetical protein MLD38_010734 [Melastoma candidum]|uniref:Uncharacterized protein n=1 Tax=Melastoma candidum TaxID=119954 RepID=A0ACB9R4B7_9MYRT|nr:hypothetical protein MLD38_010734 [Melastoma candidum]